MGREELLTTLAAQIADVRCDHPVRVAIDGVDASGKTTLADELVAPLQALGRSVIRSSVDHFHNPKAIRYRLGEISAEGYFRDSFNYPLLTRVLLEPLGPGGSLSYRRAAFDHRSDANVDEPLEQANPDAVLLFDGVFLHRPEIREYWDLSVFIRADFEVTSKRAEKRDLEMLGSVANVRRRYEQRYIPGQKLYLSEVQPERLASLVVDNNDISNPSTVPLA